MGRGREEREGEQSVVESRKILKIDPGNVKLYYTIPYYNNNNNRLTLRLAHLTEVFTLLIALLGDQLGLGYCCVYDVCKSWCRLLIHLGVLLQNNVKLCV